MSDAKIFRIVQGDKGRHIFCGDELLYSNVPEECEIKIETDTDTGAEKLTVTPRYGPPDFEKIASALLGYEVKIISCDSLLEAQNHA